MNVSIYQTKLKKQKKLQKKFHTCQSKYSFESSDYCDDEGGIGARDFAFHGSGIVINFIL